MTGNKNVKIDIQLLPPSSSVSSIDGTAAAAAAGSSPIKILDHAPSWKLHKNPFWRCKHPKFVTLQTNSIPVADDSYHHPGPTMSHSVQQQPLLAPPIPLVPKLSKNACYIYESSQDVVGNVVLQSNPNSNNVMEHLGVSVQFIGRVDMSNSSAQLQHSNFNSNSTEYDFISMSKELLPPGILYDRTTSLPFKFKNIDIDYESYTGRMVAVRYILRVKVERKFLPPVVYDKDIWFQKVHVPPTLLHNNDRIKMEVGIEDCLHIEFEYNQRHYHLHDTIRGSIRFLLVAIKLKHMELAVIRREYSGDGVAALAASEQQQQHTSNIDASNVYTETQTLVKYEIMDGAPVKGEVIPVKLSLLGIPADLTPTYTTIHHRFSVKYFLNLVLVDDDDRRYFKQQEIILWRKYIGQ